MSYTTHVRIIQTRPDPWYSIVEKTNFGSGTWSEVDCEHILSMDNSGQSGMLRFTSPRGDFFTVVVGVHNYKRWCDIVVDLSASNTGVEIHPQYYNGPRNDMLWKQLQYLEKTTSKGVKIIVDYFKQEGNTLWVSITISAN